MGIFLPSAGSRLEEIFRAIQSPSNEGEEPTCPCEFCQSGQTLEGEFGEPDDATSELSEADRDFWMGLRPPFAADEDVEDTPTYAAPERYEVFDLDTLLNDLAEGPDSFEDALDDILAGLRALMLKKHHDYGPQNISRSPGGALNGLRVRMHDKLARINNLVDSGAEPENESLEDSFRDLANYGIIGIMCLNGSWPDL